MKTTNLYEDVISVTHDKLGLAADRFVARQIRSHLQRDPKTLQPDDLRNLMDWIELAMRTAHSDQQVIDQYMEDLETLAQRANK